MKIRKIKYKDHPVLKNLELDLVNPATNKPYNTIVLAGENGSGKTTILSTLNTFLCLKSFTPFECIEYEAKGKIYQAVPTNDDSHTQLGFYHRVDKETNVRVSISSNYNLNRKSIASDELDIRHYGCVYSKARADFSVRKITGTTSLEIDADSYDDDSKEDFSSLKQLVIDLQYEDSVKLQEQIEASPTHSLSKTEYEVFSQTSKMYRFRAAFDNFFEAIKYKKVESSDGEKKVLFSKHGNDITIDDLSTGEKQIVYRGIYLLRNVGKLDGAAILIDEPELSMHPKWQRRILKYFKDLFTDNSGKQKAQLFFATHSEYVLGEALKNRDDTLVIVLKDNDGTIEKHEVKTPLALPTITASEINYVAFDVPSIDYHIALYGAIQSKYGVHSIAACDAKIESCTPYYNTAKHERPTTNPTNGQLFKTVCTKVRNHIDHPDTAPGYTEGELVESIILMRTILQNVAP
jgi:AAA15 family ATPase/GTPase